MKQDAILRKDEVTSRVQVVAISYTQPAQVTLAQRAKRPDDKVRAITQKIPVHDAGLLARLAAEAPLGTDVEATLVTEWTKNGYSSYLKDFCVAVTERIIYTQLERLLAELGYQEMPTDEDARVFVNIEYDAISLLPCAKGEKTARAHHLITLRKVAVKKGIVDAETFEKKLKEARQEPIEMLAKDS